MFRIPPNKIYRAFPELDHFSDAQCERFVQRVRVTSQYPQVLAGSLILVVVLSLTAVGLVLGRLAEPWSRFLWAAGRELRLSWLSADDVHLGSCLLALAAVPAFSCLLVRDGLLRTYLRRAIRMRLDRVRCRTCGYVLIGQRHSDGRVRCPECSSAATLRELGVTAEDLIPPPNASLDHLADAPEAVPP